MYWNKSQTIDGGMGTELVRCGAKEVDRHRLWSSIANVKEPDVVVQAHLNFINAGASVIITNSYQSNQYLLMEELNIDKTTADDYLLSTVTLAKQARLSSAKENVLIAGSIGPYPDCPASEYNPEYLKRMTVKELYEWHLPRFETLAKSDVDLLAIETIPGLKEAEALLNLLEVYPKDAYMSFACNSNLTNAGESFADIVDLINRLRPKTLRGIGINCSDPHMVTDFGRYMKQHLPEMTLVAYPNTAEKWSNESNEWGETESKWSGEQVQLHDFVSEWKSVGFLWIGGCCRVTPEQISKIAMKNYGK